MFFFVVFFSQSNYDYRGYVFVYAMIILAATGYLNGFAAAKVNRFFKTGDWKTSAVLASTIFPFYIVIMYGLSDVIELSAKSSASIQIIPAIKYTAAWLAIDVPLAILGAYHGYTTEMEYEAQYSEEEKEIPEQPWYMSPYITVPFYGLFPFLSIIVMLKYIMDSVWRNNLIYAMFGSLFINILLLVFMIAIVSISQTYHMIKHKNYHWWWRSFFVGAMGGVYMFIFSIYYISHYMKRKMEDPLSEALYFTQMCWSSFCFATMCGTISLITSYMFVERIC